MKMYCKARNIQHEAENHIKVLEEIKSEISVMLPYFKPFFEESGEGAIYEETERRAESRINALNFAIDFIRWGMK